MAFKIDTGSRTPDELLSIVKSERERSIGFDLDPVLLYERTQALDYYKGVMVDMPTRPNRSTAISTDVSDTVDTIIPELMEMFVGGDDVVSFTPSSAQDVEAAQQETEYLHQVVFQQNNGFLTIYAFVKDALLTKTGLVQWWWSPKPEVENEVFEGKTAIEAGMAAQSGAMVNLKYNGEPVTPETQLPPEAMNEPAFSFEMATEGPDGHAIIEPIAPEDFTVARDTVWLCDATYCATRSRPRRQQLKADGFDPKIIDELPPYGIDYDERQKWARDTAGEHMFPLGNNGEDPDLNVVEVITHHVRLLNKKGQLEIWRVVTGGGETILVHAEKVDRIRVAAITPNIITHRFYGRSIADLMLEIQRIKTSVLRMALDNGYFSLNQRQEVDLSKANEFTLADLMDNRPGRPVRVKQAGAVNSIGSAGAPYDFMAMLEYISTMGEQRSGAIRNSQGLNPDSLHDTASGAQQMLTESMKKIRFIGRIIAETGLKDLFLGVHALIRQHATQAVETKLRGSWVPIDPTQWAERTQMEVQIGVGSGGRPQKIAALTSIVEDQRQIAAVPGGSTYVTAQNQYDARMDLADAFGIKNASRYYTDPQTVQPPQPQPSPEQMKMQAEQQAQQAEMQQKLQIEQMRQQTEGRKLLADHVEKLEEIRSRERIEQQRLAFDHQKLGTDAAVKVEDSKRRANTSVEVAEIGAQTAARKIGADLAVQASESADVQAEAHRDRAHATGLKVLDHVADHHASTGERAHDIAMAHVNHALNEKAADAAADRAPEPKPAGDSE